MKRLFSLLVILLICSTAFSQITYGNERVKHWFLFPLVAYSSETSLIYGGVVIYDASNITKSFNGQLANVVQLSLKDQFSFISKASFSYANRYETSFAMRIKKWPTTIYELGNQSTEESDTKYTEQQYSFEFNLYRKLASYLFVGLNAEVANLSVEKREYNDFIDWNKLTGNDGGAFNGAGLVAKFDSRNRTNFPSKGANYRASYRNYSKSLGSDYDFSMTEIDLKNYFSASENAILATHLDGKFCSGDTPFQRLAKLGDRLRGYSSRRFMDNHRVSGRAELRLSPFTYGLPKRAGFVLFAETGKVANTLDEINLEDWKYSIGTGFRYQLTNSADKLNMKFDIAFTDEGHSINISAYEEF